MTSCKSHMLQILVEQACSSGMMMMCDLMPVLPHTAAHHSDEINSSTAISQGHLDGSNVVLNSIT